VVSNAEDQVQESDDGEHPEHRREPWSRPAGGGRQAASDMCRQRLSLTNAQPAVSIFPVTAPGLTFNPDITRAAEAAATIGGHQIGRLAPPCTYRCCETACIIRCYGSSCLIELNRVG
jgi:hypothetical protein